MPLFPRPRLNCPYSAVNIFLWPVTPPSADQFPYVSSIAWFCQIYKCERIHKESSVQILTYWFPIPHSKDSWPSSSLSLFPRDLIQLSSMWLQLNHTISASIETGSFTSPSFVSKNTISLINLHPPSHLIYPASQHNKRAVWTGRKPINASYPIQKNKSYASIFDPASFCFNTLMILFSWFLFILNRLEIA